MLTPVLERYFGWEAGLWIASMLCILGAILRCGIDARDESEARLAEVQLNPRELDHHGE